MKRLYAIPIVALLVLASQADAQLFRRVFNRPAPSGCVNGQCEVAPRAVAPTVTVTAEPVYAQAKSDDTVWVSQEEMADILKKLETKPGWKETVAGVRAQVAKDWKGEPSIAVHSLAYSVWLETIGEKGYVVRALAPKSFAGALQGQLAGKDSLTIGERRLLRILNGPDSERRDRQITRMERHVRAHLDMDATAAVDWAAVDWPARIGQILQLLLMLLPFFV